MVGGRERELDGRQETHMEGWGERERVGGRERDRVGGGLNPNHRISCCNSVYSMGNVIQSLSEASNDLLLPLPANTPQSRE